MGTFHGLEDRFKNYEKKKTPFGKKIYPDVLFDELLLVVGV